MTPNSTAASTSPFSLRLVWTLIVFDLGLLLATAPAYAMTGLTVVWSTLWVKAAVSVVVLFLAFLTRHDGDGVADIFLALFMLLTCSGIIGPAQYAAVAWGRPLVDPWLSAVDTSMGISVQALTQWTTQHPWLVTVLTLAYASLLFQFVLPLIVVGVFYRDRARLWEYVWHFHVCAAATLAGLALWPAACVFRYGNFPSLLDQAGFLAHFEGLRAGTFHVIRFDDIEGLISFPSFHVAGAFMVTWALRRTRRLVWIPVALLNVALVASTVLLGAHYAVDILATAVLFGASVLAHFIVVRRFLDPLAGEPLLALHPPHA